LASGAGIAAVAVVPPLGTHGSARTDGSDVVVRPPPPLCCMSTSSTEDRDV